jgi:CBS-domain-containing membrane protein
MLATAKPFLRQTAADLMSRDVVTIPEAMSLKAAASLLYRSSISGAPVVDAEGRCVGVLSTKDFLAWVQEGGQARPAPPDRQGVYCAWQVVDAGPLPVDEVRHHMTPDPVTVTPGTALGDLARTLLDGHIHRVIVLDEQRRPVGVVSSTDILAAVVRFAGNSPPPEPSSHGEWDTARAGVSTPHASLFEGLVARLKGEGGRT